MTRMRAIWTILLYEVAKYRRLYKMIRRDSVAADPLLDYIEDVKRR